MVSMLGMWLGISFYQNTISNDLASNLLSYMLTFSSYFGYLGLGSVIAFLDIKNLNNGELWDVENVKSPVEPSKLKRILTKLTKISLFNFVIIAGITLAYTTFSGGLELFGWAFAGLFNQLTLFFVFVFLSATILLLKLINRKSNRRLYYGVAITGLIVSGIFFTPLCLTPFTVLGAESQFSTSFGSDWRSKIDATVERDYFLPTPFSIPSYFLGIPAKDCVVITDQEFYRNASEGIYLQYDVYMPNGDGSGLPGKNSTIIEIHGGGWISGDKGVNAMVQRNRYLASQGYVVFDIQYGLKNTWYTGFTDAAPNVIGDFTLNQMVRHVGNFTHYLAANHTKYGANISSVFVTGGSAGGHLACMAALGIWSGNFSHYFNNTLNIKGYIPVNPANGLASNIIFNVQGTHDVNYPEELINSSSPPCLILQGTSDFLCVPVTQRIENYYAQAGNSKCATIWVPLAGHGNTNRHFPNYYNLPFMYYMERFLYLCVNDFI